jgi:hypothetical protein
MGRADMLILLGIPYDHKKAYTGGNADEIHTIRHGKHH